MSAYQNYHVPPVPAQGAAGGKGGIAFSSAATSRDEFVDEGLRTFAGVDDPESLRHRLAAAWDAKHGRPLWHWLIGMAKP